MDYINIDYVRCYIQAGSRDCFRLRLLVVGDYFSLLPLNYYISR